MVTKLKIKHIETDSFLAHDVELADSFKSRLLGLMFARDFGKRDGIYFQPSNSIHSLFVRFPFDVIFLTGENKILRIYRSFKPWRVSPIFFRARRVLELPEGSIPEEIREGDFLEVLHV